MSKFMKFRILLVDDDREMNVMLRRLLEGHRVLVGGLEVHPEVDCLNVDLVSDRPEYWRVSDETLQRLERASGQHYDLVLVDFGFADDDAKDILWGKDRSRRPSKEEAKGRLLTIRDLAEQYSDRLRASSKEVTAKTSIFLATRRVILRSFATRMAFDILGPVIPNRINETMAAFPNATVDAMDPRNEFYAGDTYYEIYERVGGRDFYRQLVGAYSLRAVETQILRTLLGRADRPRVQRSVFNVAMFAGSIALLGSTTQYLAGAGLDLLDKQRLGGWWLLGAGLAVLVAGAFVLSLYFEAFTRAVVRWVGPEGGFEDQ